MNRLAVFAATAMFAVLYVPAAHATLQLRITDTLGNSVDIGDNNSTAPSCVGVLAATCTDANPVANALTFMGTIGGWDINVTTGTSKSASDPDLIHLNSLDHTNGQGGTLTLMLSDDGYTPGNSGGFNVTFGPTISGNNATVTYQAYEDDTTKFALTNAIGPLITFHTSGSQSVSGGPAVSPSGYALTQVVTLSFADGRGNVSFDATIDPVPEPASVVLLGGILLCSATVLRRRLNRA
jgi:hypothetical protein